MKWNFKILFFLVVATCFFSCVQQGDSSETAANKKNIPLGEVAEVDGRMKVHVSNLTDGRQRIGNKQFQELPPNIKGKFTLERLYVRYHSESQMAGGWCDNTLIYKVLLGNETNEISCCGGHTSEQH